MESIALQYNKGKSDNNFVSFKNVRYNISMETVSVVIPAHNEETYIASCLTSLVNQHTSYPFEVIVVDNNSTDNTVNVVKSFEKKLHIKIVSEKRKGRGPARFAGFHIAKGDIIFSTDADCIIPSDWIEKTVKAFGNDTTMIAATGIGKTVDNGWFGNLFYLLFWNLLAIYFDKLIRGHWWLAGYNFAIRKEFYKKSGGFDPTLNSQEDSVLVEKVCKIGKISWICPTVIVSARRMRKGFALEHLKCFVQFSILGKKDVILSDVR
jgi:glycosyltransferase involved in cell wall biosynthesis